MAMRQFHVRHLHFLFSIHQMNRSAIYVEIMRGEMEERTHVRTRKKDQEVGEESSRIALY